MSAPDCLIRWVYVSDIFNTRTRHYGLAVASASQWLFNFVLSKVTPTLVDDLGYKLFLMFGAINIAGMGTFSLLIPETKGRSLEEMDIIFGAVQADQRNADIAKQERGMFIGLSLKKPILIFVCTSLRPRCSIKPLGEPRREGLSTAQGCRSGFSHLHCCIVPHTLRVCHFIVTSPHASPR